MPLKRPKLPRTSSGLKIKKAVGQVKAMPVADRVQLLVKAGLMSQSEADLVKRSLAEPSVAGR